MSGDLVLCKQDAHLDSHTEVGVAPVLGWKSARVKTGNSCIDTTCPCQPPCPLCQDSVLLSVLLT